MFKKTVNLTEFKATAPDVLALLGDNRDNDAVQLLHRGGSVKVIITQERYFRLVEALEALRQQPDELVPAPAAVDVERAIAKTAEQIANPSDSREAGTGK